VRLELGLVSTKDLTPEATLYAQILTDTKRRARRGDTPRFVFHGKGLIGLAKWEASGQAFQIEQHNAEVRKKLQVHLLAIDPSGESGAACLSAQSVIASRWSEQPPRLRQPKPANTPRRNAGYGLCDNPGLGVGRPTE